MAFCVAHVPSEKQQDIITKLHRSWLLGIMAEPRALSGSECTTGSSKFSTIQNIWSISEIISGKISEGLVNNYNKKNLIAANQGFFPQVTWDTKRTVKEMRPKPNWEVMQGNYKGSSTWVRRQTKLKGRKSHSLAYRNFIWNSAPSPESRAGWGSCWEH